MSAAISPPFAETACTRSSVTERIAIRCGKAPRGGKNRFGDSQPPPLEAASIFLDLGEVSEDGDDGAGAMTKAAFFKSEATPGPSWSKSMYISSRPQVFKGGEVLHHVSIVAHSCDRWHRACIGTVENLRVQATRLAAHSLCLRLEPLSSPPGTKSTQFAKLGQTSAAVGTSGSLPSRKQMEPK